MFSKDGPNLSNPAETNNPKVIPKICKLINNANKNRRGIRLKGNNIFYRGLTMTQ